MKNKVVTFSLLILLITCFGILIFLKNNSLNDAEFALEDEYAEFIGENDAIKDTPSDDNGTFNDNQKVVYSVYGNESLDPKILEVEIYPWSVKMGQEQSITVLAEFVATKGIEENDKVFATLITDNKSRHLQLGLIDAPVKNDSQTTWRGVWVCDDELLDHYELLIKAESISGENSVVLTLR